MRPSASQPALVLFSLLFSAFTATAAAQQWGPAIGSSMPADLALTTDSGAPTVLENLGREHKGLVVAFVRSADWCPFCKRQLIELSRREAEFAERGLRLVSVSYDSAELLASFKEQFEIEFDLLSDPDSAVIDAFGIRNEDQKPGTSGYGIPHPGIMVFDADGTLVAKFAEKSYRKRPQIDDVLAAVDALDRSE